MQIYEIYPLMSSIYKKSRESWEQTRLLGYITALGNSTKKLKPTDIIKFLWDDNKEHSDASVSSDLIERLKNKANNYINNGK